MAMTARRRDDMPDAFDKNHTGDTPTPAPTFDRVAERVKALLEEGNLDALQRLSNLASELHLPMLAAAANKRLDEELVKGIESGKIELDSPLVKQLSNNPELEKELHAFIEKKDAKEEEKIEKFIEAIEAEEDQALAQEYAAIDAEYAGTAAYTSGASDSAGDPTPNDPHYESPTPGHESSEKPDNHSVASEQSHEKAEDPTNRLGADTGRETTTPGASTAPAPDNTISQDPQPLSPNAHTASSNNPQASHPSADAVPSLDPQAPKPSFKSSSPDDPQPMSPHTSSPSLDSSSIAPPGGLPTPFAQASSGGLDAAKALDVDPSSAMSSMANLAGR